MSGSSSTMSTENGRGASSGAQAAAQRSQLPQRGLGALRTLRRVGRHELRDQRVEGRGYVGAHRAAAQQRHLDLLAVQVRGLLAAEGRDAGQQLEGQNAQRVDVDQVTGALGEIARERLGRHVLQRSGDAAMPCPVGVEQHEPEVHEHDPPARGEHHVARLDVAVGQASLVHDAERVGDGDE